VTSEGTTVTDRVDALVIFGATGDLAKLETFPALVGWSTGVCSTSR
jgi:glucose-6-phosphate 1-dehydrogenase